MDIQTEKMLKEAKVEKIIDSWLITWYYEGERYYLNIDNNFDTNSNILHFEYELDAKTYLAVLNSQGL